MIVKNSLDKDLSGRKTLPARGEPIAAFFLTAILLIIMFAIFGYYPAGEYSILSSDLSAQYAPDLIAYKNTLLSGGNLFYSTLISMGKNTMGLFAYYLSSPLNLMTFLFPAEMISEAILALIIVKLSLASAFMTLYLRSRHPEGTRFSVIFGTLYAFCSYAVVFMMHIMWMDGFYLLPLLLLVVERFLSNRRRYFSLIFLLAYMFLSGFYIAYMVGIFSFFYLIFRMIEERRFAEHSLKQAFGVVGSFIGSAVVAAMLSAVVLLPAGLDILRNPDYSKNQVTFEANFTVVEFFNQLLAGSFDKMADNKPLVYAGLAVLLLCVLFFLHPEIARRKKALVGVAFVGLFLSMIASPLNLAWHLFDEPNWFKFRYSFLLSFLLISVAYETFLKLKGLPAKAFVMTGGIFIALVVVVQGFGDLETEGARFFANLFAGIIVLLLLYAMTGVRFPDSVANLKRLVPGFLAVLLVIEAAIMNPLFLRPKVFGGENEREPLYQSIVQPMPLVETAKADALAEGVGFFRMETTGGVEAMDPMSAALYLNYPGTSTFNSSANKKLNRFLKQLGYVTNYNYFSSSHEYSSVVTDSLLGIRYVLTPDDRLMGYTDLAKSEDGTITLLRNELALPVLYAVQPEALVFDPFILEKTPDAKDPFQYQEMLLDAFFGQEIFSENVYTQIEPDETNVYNAITSLPKRDNASDQETDAAAAQVREEALLFEMDTDLLGEEPVLGSDRFETKYLRINEKDKMIISYTLTAENKDPIYFSIVSNAMSSEADVYIDGEYLSTITPSFFTAIYSIGEREPGEKVTVEIRSDADEFKMIGTLFYSLDTGAFMEQLQLAAPSDGIRIDDSGDGILTATVTREQDTVLLTTIPYEAGWTAEIDGVETEITPFADALIAVSVPAGTHTVHFSFTTPGLALGRACALTGLSILLLLGILRLISVRRAKMTPQEVSAV